MCSIEEESIAIGNSFATNADNAVPLNNDAHSLQYTQQSIIYVPQAEKKIGWSLREINKAKEICFTAQKNTFPWAEVLLGISSLFMGGFLSALFSKLPYEAAALSILGYSVCPVVGIGCFVAYIFRRNKDIFSAQQVANSIMEHLPTDEDLRMESESEINTNVEETNKQ